MSNTLEAIATIETADLYIELAVECDLYFEPADPSVGIMSSAFEADGYEMLSIGVFNEDGQAIWKSDDKDQMGLALAFLTLAGHDCDDLISAACEDEISCYDPRDSICYAP